MHKNVAGLNRLMRSYPSPLNWISNSNTYVKKNNKKLAQNLFHSKRSHNFSMLYQKVSNTNFTVFGLIGPGIKLTIYSTWPKQNL